MAKPGRIIIEIYRGDNTQVLSIYHVHYYPYSHGGLEADPAEVAHGEGQDDA